MHSFACFAFLLKVTRIFAREKSESETTSAKVRAYTHVILDLGHGKIFSAQLLNDDQNQTS